MGTRYDAWGNTPESQKRASQKYHDKVISQFNLKLNIRTDADIIEHLHKQRNKQGYIKDLIRKDMQK